MAFAIADMTLGTAERLGEHIRQGTLDTLLVRPVSPLLQIATEDFSPAPVRQAGPAVAVLRLSLPRLDAHWTPGRVALVPLMLVGGIGIFCGAVGARGRLAVRRRRRQAGGQLHHLRRRLPDAVPAERLRPRRAARADLGAAAGVRQLGARRCTSSDRPDPLGLPVAFRFASPLVAVVLSVVAALAWRAGLRTLPIDGELT